MADLLSTQPPALPASVARVDPATGKPSRTLLDYELFQRNWFANSVTDLETKIDTVESRTDANEAAITTETTARTSEDAALAQQITTVNAKANAATANGQIYFAAIAAPGGAAAAFGVYLTAGNAFTGLELLAMSDGTSSIALNASQFTLTDSGSAQRVFTYSGGVFRFNVPVQVQNRDIGAAEVSNSAVSTNAGSATTALMVRAGAQVIIRASVSNPANSLRATIQGSIVVRNFRILVDGAHINTLQTMDSMVALVINTNGTVQTTYYAITPASAEFLVTGLSEGVHMFQLEDATGYSMTCSIVVTESK